MLKLDNEFTADEAQARFPELLDRAVNGEEIRILKNGMPVVRLEGIIEHQSSTPEQRRKTIDTIREIASRNTLGGIKIKDLMEEGRR